MEYLDFNLLTEHTLNEAFKLRNNIGITFTVPSLLGENYWRKVTATNQHRPIGKNFYEKVTSVPNYSCFIKVFSEGTTDKPTTYIIY